MTLNVLIVDDSSLARRTVRNVITDLGFEAEEASDGTQAIERYFLKRHDLVILDMVMSGMYGLEVLAKLKELNPDVKVIVATADIQTSTVDQVKAAGAAAFINKPINRKQLSDTISTVLAGGSQWN
jgi:two-component system, chemotaxis family, chemotaxis protein CheY